MASSFVSVIIPCYNAAAYLGEAVQSILDQGHHPLEIIVIDDGSTDGSGDVAQSFGSQVSYISQANEGISSARNSGLRICRGDVIAFLDADDLWPVGSLAVRLKALENHTKAGCAYGRVQQFISTDVAHEERKRIICPPNAQLGRSAGSIIVTREAFQRIGYFDPDLRLGETMDWVARAEQAGVVSVVVDAVVLRRRIHENNTVRKQKELQRDYLLALRASIHRRREQANQGSY